MSSSPPRRPRSKRVVSLVDCGTSSSQPITLDEWIHERWPQGPNHTMILHKCICLATNMVFSATGTRLTAQTLVESWFPPSTRPTPSPDELDLASANAVAEVGLFKNSQPMTVIVDNRIPAWTEVQCQKSVIIKLKFALSAQAADAYQQSLDADASLDVQLAPYRHIFSIAVLIANGLQQAIRNFAARPEELPLGREDLISDIDRKRDAWHRKHILSRKCIAAGYRFEELMFGGVLIRIAGHRVPYQVSEYGSCSDLAVMLKEEGVPGYRTIKDQMLKTIVEEGECDRYFPLGLQHTNDFVKGGHRKMVCRQGDGSDKLRREVYHIDQIDFKQA